MPQKNGGFLACLFSVPKFIDPVFGLKSPIRSFFMTENESFGLVFPKTASIQYIRVLDSSMDAPVLFEIT